VRRSRALLLGLLAVAASALSLLLATGSSSAATTTVQVGDMFFCSSAFQGGVCETDVSVGDTVTWNFAGSLQHTVTDCGANCNTATQSPLFNSGPMSSGTFQFTFTTPGTYLYMCRVHPFDMRGKIVVAGAPAPTTPAPVATTPAPGGATPAPTSSGVLPRTGYGPVQQSSHSWWLALAATLAGVTLVASGAYAFARRR